MHSLFLPPAPLVCYNTSVMPQAGKTSLSPRLRGTLQPLKKTSVRLQVFEQMKNQILRGVWKPGTKIPSENQLTELFGVSRISVREALQKLVALELLDTRHGEGTFVRELTAGTVMNSLIPIMLLTKNDLLDVLEFRMTIEAGIIGLAVDRADADGIAELKALLQKMKRFKNDTAKFAAYDLEFHFALGRMTRNPVIIKVLVIMKDILSASMENIVRSLGVDIGIRYHTIILDAVRSGEKEKARRLMLEHIEATINGILEAR